MKSGTAWRARPWLEAAVCLIGLVVSSNFVDYGGGTEFSAGTVTGWLAPLMAFGELLLAIAIPTNFAAPRLALAAVLAATACELPLYAYLLAPGAFQRIMGGMWSVHSPDLFAWDAGAALGVAVLLLVDTLLLRRLGRASRRWMAPGAVA